MGKNKTDDGILADLQAARERADNNASAMSKQRVRRLEAEAKERGLDTTPRKPATKTHADYAGRKMVVVTEDNKPGGVIHITRCRTVERWWPTYVRDATDDELATITEICGHCLNDVGPTGFGSEPLAEPQGESVRTVSGGGFETNRRRH